MAGRARVRGSGDSGRAEAAAPAGSAGVLGQLSGPRTAGHLTECGQPPWAGGGHCLGEGRARPGSLGAQLARPRPAAGQVGVAGTQTS